MNLSKNDLPLYRFIVQVGFTSVLIFFCMFSLTFPQKGSQRNQALYASLISFLTGFWMPSPGQNKEGDQVAIDSEETNVFSNQNQEDKKG